MSEPSEPVDEIVEVFPKLGRTDSPGEICVFPDRDL
jgi:hypothetical protein